MRLSTISLCFASLSLFVAACGDDEVNDRPDADDRPDAAGTPTPDGGGGDQAVTLRFAARFGATPFACGEEVAGIGTTDAAFTATDLRFYVHDVALLPTGSGAAQPVTLDAGPYQGDGIALVDFEDGCGDDGTPTLHTELTGTVPRGTYDGLRFTLGVPADRNFVDLATAAAPLDSTAMFWIWQFGYKFLKLDGSTPGDGGAAPFFLHLGASGCPGTDFSQPPTAPCAYPNQVAYELAAFDPEADTVVADLAAVLATVDVTANTPETAPGCMSEPGDPECIAVLPRLGVNAAATQVLFGVE